MGSDCAREAISVQCSRAGSAELQACETSVGVAKPALLLPWCHRSWERKRHFSVLVFFSAKMHLWVLRGAEWNISL